MHTLPPPPTLRPATAADQAAITAIVRAARINPRDLAWARFLVAEQAGAIVGVGQVRPHRDGGRELASIAVAPAAQGRGVGVALVRALQARHGPPLQLYCLDTLGPFYARFGFVELAPPAMPPMMRRLQRLSRPLLALLRPGRRLLVMGWSGGP